MIELAGKYNTAKVFASTIDQSAISQIINLLNQEFALGSSIRVMPDAHAGSGCTIGTTMTVSTKVVPNLVGVDIGCGMETAVIRNEHVELEKLDKAIHRSVPAGFKVRDKEHSDAKKTGLSELACRESLNLKRAGLSIGTLGGGNHFILRPRWLRSIA